MSRRSSLIILPLLSLADEILIEDIIGGANRRDIKLAELTANRVNRAYRLHISWNSQVDQNLQLE